MKVAGVQFASLMGEVNRNYDKARTLILQAAHGGADVIVLPEMWNTSFYPDNIVELADKDGQRTQDFLSGLSRQLGVNIVGGSVSNNRSGTLYNTTYVTDRDGRIIASYDKVHLFSPGAENAVFTPGHDLNLFAVDGIPAASIICYDLRFCEWVRMAALAGAQILFVPAAWLNPRLAHWQLLNTARAVENQFFVAAVNSCGGSGNTTFCGGSRMIDPWGRVLAEAGQDEQIIMADMDFAQVQDIRSRINVFADRRPDLYRQ